MLGDRRMPSHQEEEVVGDSRQVTLLLCMTMLALSANMSIAACMVDGGVYTLLSYYGTYRSLGGADGGSPLSPFNLSPSASTDSPTKPLPRHVLNLFSASPDNALLPYHCISMDLLPLQHIWLAPLHLPLSYSQNVYLSSVGYIPCYTGGKTLARGAGAKGAARKDDMTAVATRCVLRGQRQRRDGGVTCTAGSRKVPARSDDAARGHDVEDRI